MKILFLSDDQVIYRWFSLRDGGVSLSATRYAIADLVTIKLVRDKATKICKDYGFIGAPDKTHFYNSIDHLSGTLIGDRELSLKS